MKEISEPPDKAMAKTPRSFIEASDNSAIYSAKSLRMSSAFSRICISVSAVLSTKRAILLAKDYTTQRTIFRNTKGHIIHFKDTKILKRLIFSYTENPQLQLIKNKKELKFRLWSIGKSTKKNSE